MTKVIIINGSVRQDSHNQKAANYVREELVKRGVEVNQVDISELPFIEPFHEFPVNPNVQKLRDEYKSADALWVQTPEHNHNIPAPLKNAFDWLSRPEAEGEYGIPEFVKNKKVVLGTATGPSLGKFVNEKLQDIFNYVGVGKIFNHVAIPLTEEAFTKNVFEISEEDKKNIDKALDELLETLY